ncbi:unnamed protein product [Effrenium voratum]|nr:unnamed protein product [Effrenium voratum]
MRKKNVLQEYQHNKGKGKGRMKFKILRLREGPKAGALCTGKLQFSMDLGDEASEDLRTPPPDRKRSEEQRSPAVKRLKARPFPSSFTLEEKAAPESLEAQPSSAQPSASEGKAKTQATLKPSESAATFQARQTEVGRGSKRRRSSKAKPPLPREEPQDEGWPPERAESSGDELVWIGGDAESPSPEARAGRLRREEPAGPRQPAPAAPAQVPALEVDDGDDRQMQSLPVEAHHPPLAQQVPVAGPWQRQPAPAPQAQAPVDDGDDRPLQSLAVEARHPVAQEMPAGPWQRQPAPAAPQAQVDDGDDRPLQSLAEARPMAQEMPAGPWQRQPAPAPQAPVDDGDDRPLQSLAVEARHPARRPLPWSDAAAQVPSRAARRNQLRVDRVMPAAAELTVNLKELGLTLCSCGPVCSDGEPDDMAEEEDLDPRWRLRRQLLRLNSLAWARAEQKETQQALRALGIPQEVDLSSVCRELGTFETQAEVEAPDLAVCDVLAFLQHATPAEQDFKKLNDSESHTAIHRIQERGLSLKKFKELYLFLEGLSRQGILPWYDRSARLAGIPLQEANFYQVNYWVIEPFTAREDMSYMEIVSDESAQRPTWFISHWWGEAM